MADGDPAAIAAPQRLLDDGRKIGVRRIEIEIDMEIGGDAMPFGEIEYPPDMVARVGVGIGRAADEVRAATQRFIQQGKRFRLVGQPFLGEGA